MFMIELVRRSALAIALLLPVAGVAQAEGSDWPSRPITITMGFPPGAGTDVVLRTLQPLLDKALGQRIVIDYKAGAGGNVASEVVANARPDGYSFLMGTAGTHGINAALYKKLSFDVESDFTPISTVVDVSNVLTINPKAIDATDVKDFIARVKAAPGKYNYASTGNGAGTHLAFAEFNACGIAPLQCFKVL
jgi:tripartite-type tricarboxylate transporter receptor subunit TctC